MIASVGIFWVIFAVVGYTYVLFSHLEHVDAPPDPHQAMLARCEQEHAALMRGDDRAGIYGNYPPADLGAM